MLNEIFGIVSQNLFLFFLLDIDFDEQPQLSCIAKLVTFPPEKNLLHFLQKKPDHPGLGVKGPASGCCPDLNNSVKNKLSTHFVI